MLVLFLYYYSLQTFWLQAIWWTTFVSWWLVLLFMLFNVCCCWYRYHDVISPSTWVWCAWFPGGWCFPDGYADRQQRASSGIEELLPWTSPYDIIDDGSNSVNLNGRDTHGNTTGLSHGEDWSEVPFLAMLTTFTGCRPFRLIIFVKEIQTYGHTHLLEFTD